MLIPLVAEAVATTVILFVLLVVEMDSDILSALDFPVNVVLLLTVYLAPTLPTLVFPLYQPSAIYVLEAVILGKVTWQLVALFWIVHVPIVEPIEDTFEPLLYVTVTTLLVIA